MLVICIVRRLEIPTFSS